MEADVVQRPQPRGLRTRTSRSVYGLREKGRCGPANWPCGQLVSLTPSGFATPSFLRFCPMICVHDIARSCALALCLVRHPPSPQRMGAHVLCTAAQLHAYAGMCALCRYCHAAVPARDTCPIAGRECATFARTFAPLRYATRCTRQAFRECAPTSCALLLSCMRMLAFVRCASTAMRPCHLATSSRS